jgi:hypothetical protein
MAWHIMVHDRGQAISNTKATHSFSGSIPYVPGTAQVSNVLL